MNSLRIKKISLVSLFIILSILFAFFILYLSYHNKKTESINLETMPQTEKEEVNENFAVETREGTAPEEETATEEAEKSILEETTQISEENKAKESSYPLHTEITATVFWVGEPQGNGSSEDNSLSAWDDNWQKHFGCFDDPQKRNGYHPKGCRPKENPFYFDLPYNDFDWEKSGGRRKNAYQVVPWAGEKKWGENESMLKNRWVKIIKGNRICYGQWEDAGPYVYDDAVYVFGSKDERPKNKKANNAGMDVSPALRDCLGFEGINNDQNKVAWQFVDFADVPSGPWKEIITTSGTFWQ